MAPISQSHLSPARRRAEGWFRQTLVQLEPRGLLQQALAATPELGRYQRILVIALGKAALPMAQAWIEAVPRAQGAVANARMEAWVAYPDGVPLPAWTQSQSVALHLFAGGHPEPNLNSLRAARGMLAAARRLAATAEPALLAALISGGGSALAELPVEGGLAATRRLYRALVHSGAGIADINVVRKHRSAFKGGRLAAAAAAPHVDQISWVLSDVPGDDLAAVASGPTFPDPSTVAEAEAVQRRWLPPVWAGVRLQETPNPGDPLFARSRWHRLADNRLACQALAGLARAAGYAPVEIDAAADEWDSAAAAKYLAERWRRLRAQSPRPCLISGGEVRVQVPAGARGRGGRNQDLAVRVAQALAGEKFCFLSAGTDGVDGSSSAAGACIDGDTLARARAAGFDADASLRAFDTEPLLEAAGALLRTGPTGNNLRDLRLFL